MSTINYKVAEIFKTNIDNSDTAELIIKQLKEILPRAKINFDLHDCDKILRIEATPCEIDIQAIINCVHKWNILIEVLL